MSSMVRDKLMDGWIKRERWAQIEEDWHKWEQVQGQRKYSNAGKGVSLCHKGGYSFPGLSPLASCLRRTS